MTYNVFGGTSNLAQSIKLNGKPTIDMLPEKVYFWISDLLLYNGLTMTLIVDLLT